MQVPLKITFRDMPTSAAVEDQIRERVEGLEQFHDRITACRVVIETPHRHHHQGRLHHVRIELTVPGRTLVVDREPHAHHSHEDVHVAIRDAFDAVRRQLEDHVRTVRGDTKQHVGPSEGRIAKLFPAEGYGFIATSDGREVYFHRRSVVDGDFDRLRIGETVRFSEELGEQGPQASTVHVSGR